MWVSRSANSYVPLRKVCLLAKLYQAIFVRLIGMVSGVNKSKSSTALVGHGFSLQFSLARASIRKPDNVIPHVINSQPTASITLSVALFPASHSVAVIP